jgi:type II secretory pathway pseudopilin PulG
MMRRRHTPRGFTLVELMVALSGGLFISLAVFALARDTGRFYQQESRLANATLGAIGGFQRLRDDIARAGYMSSPNLFRDQYACAKPDGSWPAALQNLASVRIDENVLTSNGRKLDRITLAGAYSSTDQFPIRQIVDNTTSYEVLLVPNSSALNRIGYATSPTQSTLDIAFPAGRALRIVDTDGMQYIGQINHTTPGANPSVTLNSAPKIPFRAKAGSTLSCGIKGYGIGAQVNVINIVQYQVRSLATDANYAALFAASQGSGVVVPGEATRTELARVELDTAGTPIANATELVAEYAVDLQFAFSAVNTPVNIVDPTLAFVPPYAATFAAYTGATFNTAATPELIRSVRIRLGVRSREADRDTDIGTPSANVGLYRINVLGSGGSSSASPQFARVRTFQGDATLVNQQKVLW